MLRGRLSLRSAGVVFAVAVASVLSAGVAVANPPVDFVDEVVLDGLTFPTNVEFAPNGWIFVAEKGGTIQVFEDLDDPTPTQFANLSANVHDYWDRGLLGMAVHPDFPEEPYIYVLYTYKTSLDGTQTWGDSCDSPPGGTQDGCVVSGRLSRLTAAGQQMTGSEEVLINDWCQQFPSHSIGDLVFGPDGALYASGGDGASFNGIDYGQRGGTQGDPEGPNPPTPVNPCADPPLEGGALRAQDLRESPDPVSLDGTVIRIDPDTGSALPDNPGNGPDPNEDRIIAYGLRNPFRMTIRPGTDDLFIGDVGWGLWEEVNVHSNPTGAVRNYGWPCYEGGSGTSIRQGTYDSQDLPICEDLYGPGNPNVTASLFAYHHNSDITGNDTCPPAPPPQPTSSSISGLAFYEGGAYPDVFDGALFGSDYSRNCIWVMYADGTGAPDPSTVEVFHDSAAEPVELEAGPDGDIYYVNINYAEGANHGEVRRLRYKPPVAVIDADPESGPAPLEVEFDGSASSVPAPYSIVDHEWDFDDDGVYDDTGPLVDHIYEEPGSYTARLRVTDSKGDTATTSINIQASNTAPTATIDSPSDPLPEWHVGETITFSGSGYDNEDGPLPESSMSWDLIIHHCADDGTCHPHQIQTFPGAGGSFAAPDHEYPSHLELRLTVVDQFGVEGTKYVLLDPELVDLTFATTPTGLEISFFGEPETAPFTETLIVGANVEISTEAKQGQWRFANWSNGGDRVQSFAAPASPKTYTATFEPNGVPVANAGPDRSVTVGQTAVLDGTGSSDPNGDSLTHAWSILSRPAGSTAGLASAGTAKPKLTPDVAGTYTIRLRVNDGTDNSFDQVRVFAGEVQSSGNGTFKDDDQSMFEGSIEWLAARRITLGCNPPINDMFCPKDLVTRGQMAAFFARALEWTDAGAGDLYIDDDGSTHEHSIDLMGTAGVTKGCNPPDNNRFCPDDFVTRAQMASFFARAFLWTDVGSGDLFKDDNGLTYEHDIDLMGTAGVTKGCNPPDNDRFCPNDFVTREQMAAFFQRAFLEVT